jgi:hypothetical protein
MANSSEVSHSNEYRNSPKVSAVAPADDVRTIMLNQVSWGAVFAGAAIALVLQIILNMVGIGVGLSTIDVAPTQQAAATDKAAEALAKAQNIAPDQAKHQVEQYQQQYHQTVGQAKERAKHVADTTAKTASQGALFAASRFCLGLLLRFLPGEPARLPQR